MGHAHHFLSRLDRVSLPHVELALTLYRDEGLLQYLFERAHVPQRVERVALSLDDPKDGPFLILTRDGKFVTCLAKGMNVGELPVITRGQIDAIAAKAGDLRERLNAAAQLAGGRGVNALLRRIYDTADEMSREDFVAISALQPLYAMDFLRLYFGAGCDLADARDVLLPLLRKTDKLKPIYNDALRSYWQTLWAMGNLVVLACMDGAEGLPQRMIEAMSAETPLSWSTTRQGIIPIALRGVWATARIGKPLLSQYKRLYREALSRLQNVDTAAGILAIGMRHSRLRAEAEKALGADIPERLKGTLDGDLASAIRTFAGEVAEMERNSPEKRLQLHQTFGARLTVAWRNRISAPHLRFERPEDVPREIALLMAVNAQWSYLEKSTGDAKAIMWFFMMLPWVARAAPEDLYFPRDVLRAMHEPWRPEMTLNVLRQMRDHLGVPNQPVQQEGPTRKGPCPCGSGKKYKRCCEVDKAEEDAEEKPYGLSITSSQSP